VLPLSTWREIILRLAHSFPVIVSLFVLVVLAAGQRVAGSRQLAAAEKQQLQQPPIASDRIAGPFAAPCASPANALCMGLY